MSAIDDIDLAATETVSDLTGGRVALLASLAAIGSLATNIILPAFPEMADSFGVGTRDLGVTLSSFFVAFAVGQLVIGPLSDRYGRRRLVLGGLFAFFAGAPAILMGTLALSATQLGLFFAAIGAGLGAMLPFSPAAALSTVLVGGCALALVAFVGHRH